MAQELRLAEALQLALQQNGEVQVQLLQLEGARAQQEIAQGPFDWQWSAQAQQKRSVSVPARATASGSGQTLNWNTSYQAGLSKLWTNGISLDSSLNANASQDVDAAGIAAPQKNNLSLSLSFNLPLLRGPGDAASGLQLQAAGLGVQAAQASARQQTAQVIQNVFAAYWDYLARSQQLQLAQSTVQRAQQLLESTQKLVAADEKPRADLLLLQADLSDKQNSLLSAELALQDSRRSLGRLLGQEAQASAQLGSPRDPFPQPDAVLERLLPQASRLNQKVLAQRADLQALQAQTEQARVLVQAADKERKPKLDLNLGMSLSRAAEGGSRYGFITAAGQNASEPSVFARLNYTFAVDDHAASGNWRASVASLTQTEVRWREARRQAETNLDAAWQRVATSARQLQAARRSLALYEQVVQQEIVKQRSGISTLIDVITVESRYNSAQASLIALQADYAKALATLLYEADCLLPATAPGVAVQLEPARLLELQPLQALAAS